MAKGKQKSLTVLLSLLTKLKDSEKHDDMITEITNLLIMSGVCTDVDVDTLTKRWDSMVSEIENKLSVGVTYKEAYNRISKKYPEFTNINLN